MVAKATVRLRRKRMDDKKESGLCCLQKVIGYFELGCFCAAMGTEAQLEPHYCSRFER